MSNAIGHISVPAIPAVALAFLLAACATGPRGAGAVVPSVVGTWRLVSSESRSDDGQSHDTFGMQPSGVLMYDANGRMSVHLMRRDRVDFASGDSRRGTPEEVKAAFESYLSYYGTYAVDAAEGTVSHCIEGCSYPNWTGTTQKRFLNLSGKRLSLSTPPIRTDGKDVRVFLIWERLE